MKLVLVSPDTVKEATKGTSLAPDRLGAILGNMTDSEERGIVAWAADAGNEGKSQDDFAEAWAGLIAKAADPKDDPGDAARALFLYAARAAGAIVRRVDVG